MDDNRIHLLHFDQLGQSCDKTYTRMKLYPSFTRRLNVSELDCHFEIFLTKKYYIFYPSIYNITIDTKRWKNFFGQIMFTCRSIFEYHMDIASTCAVLCCVKMADSDLDLFSLFEV